MNGHYSVITNFGCHWTCPYCIVRKTGLNVPVTDMQATLRTISRESEHLLPHIVSHECVHVAMGLYNAEILGYRHKAKACKHMTVSNELVAYVQSELFRCVMEFLADAVKTTEEEQ